MVTFSNPRLHAVIEDYPLGGNKRGPCKFDVEFKKGKGWKFFRTTTGKPKSTIAYGGRACIVDGSDGRTYLIQHGGIYDAVTIYASDMKNPDPKVLGCDHYVPSRDERYAELCRLIKEANAAAPVAG